MKRFDEKQAKANEFSSNKIVLFNDKNFYTAIDGDADIISLFLRLPEKKHKVDNGIYGIEKHNYIKFSKDLYNTIIEKLNGRLEVVII